MVEISVDEAATNLRALLEQVANGEEIILIQEDHAVARIVPMRTRAHWLARIRKFRNTLQVEGEPLSATIVKARQGKRY